jgi:hypothetical protein
MTRGPHSRSGRAARIARVLLLCALAAVPCIIPLHNPAAAYTPQESRMLMQIKEIAPGFGGILERLVFQRGFARIDCRRATEKIYDWILSSQYPHLPLFLESLTETDVAMLVDLFKQDSDFLSSPELPLFEELRPMGQYTVLGLPFKGEFFVLRGNDEPPDHDPAGAQRYAWDFVIMKKNSMFQGAGDANEHYFVWGAALRATAPGAVVSLMQDTPDLHPSDTTGGADANQIVIDHGAGEQSVIRHIMQHSASVSVKQRVNPGDIIARAGNNGGAGFPLIHFQLDKSKQGNQTPMQARFAVYFARDEHDLAYRLVVSGIPARGQFIMDVETAIGAPAF